MANRRSMRKALTKSKRVEGWGGPEREADLTRKVRKRATEKKQEDESGVALKRKHEEKCPVDVKEAGVASSAETGEEPTYQKQLLGSPAHVRKRMEEATTVRKKKGV